jgi:hypothetical protein
MLQLYLHSQPAAASKSLEMFEMQPIVTTAGCWHALKLIQLELGAVSGS